MLRKTHGRPLFLLVIIAFVCLMIRYGYYTSLHETAASYLTNTHSEHETELQPLLRLSSTRNIKQSTNDDDAEYTVRSYTSIVKPTARREFRNEETSQSVHQPKPNGNTGTNKIKQPLSSSALIGRDSTRHNRTVSHEVIEEMLRTTRNKSTSLMANMMLQRPTSFKSKPETKAVFDLPMHSDEVYAVPDLETLRLKQQHQKFPVFVLLVTYARSGSTWLGSITSLAESSMYVYEPLHSLVEQGYYKKNEVCFFNDVCRAPAKITERHEFSITAFYRLFTCQFTKLHPDALNIFIKELRSPSLKQSLVKCLNINKSYTQCLHEVEKKCLQTDHRILKTVRMSMELVHIMLDLWPNLKVLHLIRDPRGITNSRQHSKHSFSYSNHIVPHSRAMCSRMFNDLEQSKVISETFPGRSKILFYEALAERPTQGAQYIYDFIESNLTNKVLNLVYSSANADVRKEQYFGTKRSNSTESAYHWRNELTLSSVQWIDKTCEKIYERLGFLALNTTEKLQSLDIPSRIKPSHIDGFV